MITPEQQNVETLKKIEEYLRQMVQALRNISKAINPPPPHDVYNREEPPVRPEEAR